MIKDMTEEDINRTYGGTFIGLRTEGQVLPCFVERGRSDNVFRVNIHRGDDVSVEDLNINDPRIVYTFPDSTAVSLPESNKAAYVSRKAQRQWHRGIREAALVITGGVGYSHRLVHAMYNPSYMGFSAACQTASERGSGAAIDKNFWLLRGDYKNIAIMFRKRIIGEVAEGGEIIIPNAEYKSLFEEVVSENP